MATKHNHQNSFDPSYHTTEAEYVYDEYLYDNNDKKTTPKQAYPVIKVNKILMSRC